MRISKPGDSSIEYITYPLYYILHMMRICLHLIWEYVILSFPGDIWVFNEYSYREPTRTKAQKTLLELVLAVPWKQFLSWSKLVIGVIVPLKKSVFFGPQLWLVDKPYAKNSTNFFWGRPCGSWMNPVFQILEISQSLAEETHPRSELQATKQEEKLRPEAWICWIWFWCSRKPTA